MKNVTKIMTFGVLLALAVVPVSASAQVPDGGDGQPSVSRPDMSKVREQARIKATENMTTAEERKAATLKQAQERRVRITQKVCERRQQSLVKVIPRLAQGAKSVKSSIDTVYARVASFYEQGQLTVANYGELVDNVESAKANAEAAIAAIGSQKFELDCGNAGAGQQLDGYRLAVQSARSALKDYKKALVELISAMKAAAAAEQGSNSSDAAGGAQNSRQNNPGGNNNE